MLAPSFDVRPRVEEFDRLALSDTLITTVTTSPIWLAR